MSAATGKLVAPGAVAGGTFTINCLGYGQLRLVVNPTVASAGNTVQVTIKAHGTDFTDVILAGTALATAGAVVMRVSPNLAAVANLTAQDVLPELVDVVVVVAGTVAYGIDYELGV